MSAALERSLRILELLAKHPEGCALSSVSIQLRLPLSATHRLLTALSEAGYIKQSREQGDYFLTMKLVSLGFSFLSNAGVVDIAQPMLDRLAEDSGELVRLGVLDGESLTFVGKAQGATRGLRYDPIWGCRSDSLQRRGPRVARDPDGRGSAGCRRAPGLRETAGLWTECADNCESLAGLPAIRPQTRVQHDHRGVRSGDECNGRGGAET